MADIDAVADRDDDAGTPHERVLRRAYRRAKRCQERYSTAHERWLRDYKIEHADSWNNYQWPVEVLDVRMGMPSLTVNEIQVHLKHITNEAKQNKSEVRFRPVSDDATPEAAQVFEGLYRHIKNVSDAPTIEGQAIEHQVGPGLGYTVVRSRFLDGDLTSDAGRREAMSQEIYIDGVADPRTVWLDPDAVRPDAEDARFGFIFADNPRDEMENKYPELEGRGARDSAFGEQFPDVAGLWLRADTIRQAEYYEVSETPDELLADNEGTIILASAATPKLVKLWQQQADDGGWKLKRRDVVVKKLRCYTIVGDLIVDETDLPGTTVPIVPWIGVRTVIDGEVDYKGHTRTMISAQQMINYNYSSSVEGVAMQTRSEWLVTQRAIEGLNGWWGQRNDVRLPYLVWNDVSDDGNGPIPPPQRLDPPQGSPAYMEGIQTARSFMMSVSGQYEATLGDQGNERTGRAINERQRQGDRATYHFINNQAMAQRRQGRIVQEWIPAIYDTPRVLRILGEDDTESHVQLDPSAKLAHQAAVDGATAIFNPNVGKYEVIADVGPDYGTQRQEGFDAMLQFVGQSPEMMAKIGDLMFKLADFPMSDQIAERLKPGLSPEAQAAIKQLQDHMQLLQKAASDGETRLREAMQALSEERLKSKDRDNDNVVRGFDADTRRLAVLKDVLASDPADMMGLIHETVRQALQDNLGPMVETLTRSTLANAADGGPPGAAGELPPSLPDPGRQAATVGGM